MLILFGHRQIETLPGHKLRYWLEAKCNIFCLAWQSARKTLFSPCNPSCFYTIYLQNTQFNTRKPHASQTNTGEKLIWLTKYWQKTDKPHKKTGVTGLQQASSIACWNITIVHPWSFQGGKLWNLSMKTGNKTYQWRQELEDFREVI